MSAKTQSYWGGTMWLFLILAFGSSVLVNQTMGSVWVACALVCHATRTVLNAIEAVSPTPNADEGERK